MGAGYRGRHGGRGFGQHEEPKSHLVSRSARERAKSNRVWFEPRPQPKLGADLCLEFLTLSQHQKFLLV